MSIIKMNFNTNIAKLVGTDSAIIYSNIEYWVCKNKANERHFYDGRYWTYNSIKAFSEMFDYLSVKQIRNCLDKLEKSNLIIKGNYNQSSYDRTTWYALVNDFIEEEKGDYQMVIFDLPETANGFDEKGNTIPNYNTNNKLNNIPSSKKSKILFKNSIYYSIEEVRNYLLKNQNYIKKYKGVDLDFYIDAVFKWSESSDTKRTDNGWIATIRTFMDSDIDKKKLKTKNIIINDTEGDLKKINESGKFHNF